MLKSNVCCHLYRWIITVGEWFQPLLLLILRLYWGYAFHVAGCSKFSRIDKVVDFFTSLAIPFPEFNAYLVATVECVGGTLLIVGLTSRLVAIPMAITMTVALLTAHLGATLGMFSNQPEFLEQGPVTYLMVALIVFAFGPGKLSIDGLLCSWMRKKGDN